MEDETAMPIRWEGAPELAKRGCCLGNRAYFLRADADANADGLWLAANNRWYLGEMTVRVVRAETKVVRVIYAPAYQAAIYQDGTGARWEKRLLLGTSEAHVYHWLQGQNFEPGTSVEIVCDCRIGAARSETHRAQPSGQDCERQWRIETLSAQGMRFRPGETEPDRLDLSASRPLTDPVWTEPARVRLTFTVPITSTGSFQFWTCLRLWAQGPEALTVCTADPPRLLGAEEETQRKYTPVERAVNWGKIGSHRVWHTYLPESASGFTNDPPGNTIVTRDAAWFVFGADHFAPLASLQLLSTLTTYGVYPNGKIAEYIRIAPEGVTHEDYGLNINDATPLFILAVAHHGRHLLGIRLFGDLYEATRRAAEWILAQRRTDGLVWCDGKGTNVWGSGGWRNIIPGYRLSGALTELNALCVAALRAAATLAEDNGDRASQERFAKRAVELDAAMAQLVDPETGYFYLNRDENGPNPQLAIDLALPALFQAGPEAARVKTLLRLVEDDFRGPKGLRTLSRNDPAYHPRFAWGLMGGSWPNATAWAAAALAPYRPELAQELAEEIARSLFPETWGPPGVSVPGQFAEWFDGDTGESGGMSLSPWMPATYVWLIEEGLKPHKIAASRNFSGESLANRLYCTTIAASQAVVAPPAHALTPHPTYHHSRTPCSHIARSSVG